MRDFRKTFSISLVLCLLMPCVAAAQGSDLRGRKTRINYYRQIGGSCIYGKNEKLAYAPKGVDCPSEQGAGTSGDTKRVSPQLEAELDRYREEHEAMDEAFAELRETISDRDYKQATKLLDRLRIKIASHKRREEALYDRLRPAAPASPGPASNETTLE